MPRNIKLSPTQVEAFTDRLDMDDCIHQALRSVLIEEAIDEGIREVAVMVHSKGFPKKLTRVQALIIEDCLNGSTWVAQSGYRDRLAQSRATRTMKALDRKLRPLVEPALGRPMKDTALW